MTTDEIVAGIDRALADIDTERARLLAARAELADRAPSAPAAGGGRATARRRAAEDKPRRERGKAPDLVLAGLDEKEPRTAGEVAKRTRIERTHVAATLSRLVKQGKASKAKRGYLRAPQ